MKEQQVVRLIKRIESGTVDTGYVILIDGEGFSSEQIKPFNRVTTYQRKSLVVYRNIIYRAILQAPAGDWDANKWERVDNAYAEVNKLDITESYPEDSFVIGRDGKLMYSLLPVNQGQHDRFTEVYHGLKVNSAIAYFPEYSTDEAIVIKGTLSKLFDARTLAQLDPIGDVPDPEEEFRNELTDKIIAYYDASEIKYMSTSFAEENGPNLNDKVAFIRDLSGNGNHAVQIDVKKRPKLKKDRKGRFYLRFDPGDYMETIQTFNGDAHQYVNIGGSGVPRFHTSNNGRIKIGMKSIRRERFWAWGGEAVVADGQNSAVLSEVRSRQMALCRKYQPKTQGTGYYLFAGESDLVDGLSDFVVTGLTNFTGFFDGCRKMNDDLSAWNVSACVSMRWMFKNCESFNGDISTWDVSSVNNMQNMFSGCDVFDSDISRWDLSSCLNTTYMFRYCTNFDIDISGWDMSSVTDSSFMFDQCSSFNQPIGVWNTSNILLMDGMMANAPSFEQDLSTWCVEQITTRPAHFANNTPIDGTANEPLWGQPCP